PNSSPHPDNDRTSCGGTKPRWNIALWETLGGMDADMKPTGTYSRRVSQRAMFHRGDHPTANRGDNGRNIQAVRQPHVGHTAGYFAGGWRPLFRAVLPGASLPTFPP